MIVICTKCKAKFRVADEKIGPRGAKVRCSRCQNVFVVHPAPPLENPFAAAPFAQDGAAAGLAPAALAPPPLPPALDVPPPLPHAPARAADPFAADPFAAPPGEVQAPDPFADADPFQSLPGPPADPFAPAADDPFAAAPPGPAAPGLGAAPGPPLTDLADLLGADLGAAAPAPAAADGPTPSDLGLSLEERVTPRPIAVAVPDPAPTAFAADPGAVLETATPHDGFPAGGLDGGAFDPGGFELGAAGEVAAAAPAEPGGPATLPAAAPLPAAHVAAAPAETPALAPAPAPRPQRGARDEVAVERVPRVPGSRIRAVLVNAVALAALLLVALTLLVVWRTEGPLDASALRPAAILAALRRGGAAAGPFAAQELRSGLYERERGPPVLFVRGKVVSRAPGAVRSLTVAVEVVQDGQVVARGAALAGAVPTAEELHGAPDAAALARVARAAEARAPAAVKPGESVPFLVAIADHPADLEGATLRVAVAPAGGPAR